MKQIHGKALSLIMFSFCIFGQAYGQEARPEKLKVKNNDLRGEREIFSVSNPKNISQNLSLLESGESQFLLELAGKDRRKVSGESVQKADGVFVKGFIDLKYGTRPAQIGDCPHYVTLFFRGDTEKVCSGDDKRMAKIDRLLQTVKHELKEK